MNMEKEVIEDKELSEFLLTLTKEEFDKNLLELFKQHLNNNKCKNCMGKKVCTMDPEYMQSYLTKNGSDVYLNYRDCKYKAKDFIELYMPNTSYDGKLYTTEERANVLNQMKEVLNKNTNKGIYLHGKFGTGKTYLMLKLAKSISKEKNVMYVYYPELINQVKNSFSNGKSMNKIIDGMKKVDALFIDDIGREQNTEFNRDQILGPIIQYRYNNNLQTFMTSNYNVYDLKEKLKETKDKIEYINADAIIDRIVHMMEIINLDGKDYRL